MLDDLVIAGIFESQFHLGAEKLKIAPEVVRQALPEPDVPDDIKTSHS